MRFAHHEPPLPDVGVHFFCPVGQLVTSVLHVPSTHVSSIAHFFEQSPQLLGSLETLRQPRHPMAPHAFHPGEHARDPPLHTSP